MAEITTRERIVAEADRLFYENGYEHTSFADIANAVGISRGNFYYHFKSKDEILDAVIAERLLSTSHMLKAWEAESASPSERIKSFIFIVVTNQAQIIHHGCPVGTLCSELAKLGHPALPQSKQLFALFRTWLRQQFLLLGHGPNADSLAMHVLAFSQGVALLAHSFHDEHFVKLEAERMSAWLDSITGVARASIQ
ncbi:MULTISPECIES: TetR/AcrR family transcriptional regulator [unclassified Pseudomonas]|uniref:TetR/AcrR family transcriptional regulator n=1 Tax=unclassified Pseudomonas TaxID=196821 RepID=UPI00119B40EC|nr:MULTISPECIES: TetR/AcrR family transcriptional regulator [unclassified Pseudomonas]TWC14528.1 TetR family transcriptional regulator [Pseudomonas sp. SJZ075]TWC15357.1 TetR family transcriptional regulator [Pseudomonas sp. SJZ074]TWC30946.1 TetR family transcriptional regulator [Pseudomonas sp. SJZ078]TWC33703.1 TetR family transcriptional regulator [Pseudomonas sp. SJZ085]TWC51950.1 TetR family transcriptional regulator [Pseudomonas sp. SJZ124]